MCRTAHIVSSGTEFLAERGYSRYLRAAIPRIACYPLVSAGHFFESPSLFMVARPHKVGMPSTREMEHFS
jgi:hypothetical protein